MTVNELLKKLAQIMYDKESEETSGSESEDLEDTGVFMPPLQAEIELLKKSTGVENVYDQEDVSSCDEQDYKEEEEDELDSIKRIAGIDSAIIAGSIRPPIA
jgi:hypothetical protein